MRAQETDTLELRLGGLEWMTPTRRQRLPRRRRHRFRRTRRMTGSAMAILLLAGIVLAGLWLVTPRVDNAPLLVSMSEHGHGAASTAAQAFPVRFNAALLGLAESSPHTRIRLGGATGALSVQFLEPTTRARLALGSRLASILYMHGRSGLLSTIEDAVLSLKFYQAYSLRQLVRLYAAVANFGNGHYGLAAASEGYFGRRPATLSWAQLAMLAALTTSTSARNPYTDLAAAKIDQAEVLQGMVLAGTISRDQALQALHQPLHLVRH